MPARHDRRRAGTRAFIALWPDSATRQQFARIAEQCAHVAHGRAVPAHNLHLTLAFLGNLPDDMIEAVKSELHATAFAPFTLQFDQVGFWPRARIIWTGARVIPDELRDLAAQVRGMLDRQGLPVERRRFAAHVTLVRKAGRRPRVEPEPIAWWVNGLHLVGSTLTPDGACYEMLAEVAAKDGN